MQEHYDIGRKCFGMYLGTVVQHLTHGQLKVYIQSIYPEEWAQQPSLLPICHQVTPQFAGSHEGNGVFSYPNIGSTVVCFFANGDQNFPITIGSLLGGMNAFGQYEIIKTNDELSSSKHLVTAGKSHYMMHESGKISAIVVDPIRTEASVAYETGVDAPLSIDAVESREVCDQVANEEISSIDCQHVLDNFYGHGTISSSTHYFNPTSYTNNTFLSVEQQNITESKNGRISTDSYCIVDNDGHREFGQISSTKSTAISNVIDLAQQANSNEIVPLTSDVKTSFKHNIDGSNQFATTSSITDAYNYSYYNNSSKESILSTHNIKVKADAAYGYYVDTQFDLSSCVNCKAVELYANSSTGDNKTKNLKYTKQASIISNGKNQIEYSVLSSSRLSETDQKIGLESHTNKHSSSAVDTQSTNGGIQLDCEWNDDDTKVTNGTTIQTKYKNFAKCDINSGENPSIERSAQKKYTKIINGSQQDYDVICEETISPTDGEISLSITDNKTKMGCTFSMDSKGNMKISATTSIAVDAPSMTFTGTNMTQTFANETMTAQQMNIVGTNGDCKIKNVSLLNHKHMETQAGDVVAPQATLIATASN